MIQMQNISKVYKIYERRLHRLQEWASFTTLRRHKQYWALRDVSLQITPGKVLGIIGMNGAGKSTLLKILTGTCIPSSGQIKIEGRVAALLELGTGFHPELSGRENVTINGRLLGLTREELQTKMQAIKDFSELGDFFDEPLRTYSSGMYVRLAFSMAVCIDPKVLIVDEALSVGDAYFQQKCLAKLKEFKSKGTTILFVSHDPGVITSLCDEVALLDKGQLIFRGHPQDCLELYNALLAKKDGQTNEYVISPEVNTGLVSGNKKAEIKKVDLLDPRGAPLQAVTSGDKVLFKVQVQFNTEIEDPTVGILIKDRLGYEVFGTNTAHLKKQTGKFAANHSAIFQFLLDLNLGPGTYTLTAAVHSSTTHVEDCFQWIDRVLTFQVLPRSDFTFLGVTLLKPNVEVIRI